MKVLIVDDHPVAREGMRRLLSVLPNVEFHEAATREDAYPIFRTVHPDVTVLDIDLAGVSGIEVLRYLKRERPQSRVVIFSMHSDSRYATRALKAGAMGYVSKGADPAELLHAIKKVISGERYLEQSIASEIVFNTSEETPIDRLSDRELEILRLIGDGKSFAQIADSFGLTYKTIANACGRMKDKLGIARTGDLIRLSVQQRMDAKDAVVGRLRASHF